MLEMYRLRRKTTGTLVVVKLMEIGGEVLYYDGKERSLLAKAEFEKRFEKLPPQVAKV